MTHPPFAIPHLFKSFVSFSRPIKMSLPIQAFVNIIQAANFYLIRMSYSV